MERIINILHFAKLGPQQFDDWVGEGEGAAFIVLQEM